MTRDPERGAPAPPSGRDGWILALPLLSTPLLTAAIGTAVRAAAGSGPGRALPPGEIAVHLVVDYALLALSRHPFPFLFAQAVVIAFGHAAQSLRVAILAGPIRPADFQAVPELLRVLDLRGTISLAGPFVLLAAILVTNRGFRRGPALAAAGLSALLAGAFLVRPAAVAVLADGGLPYVPWSHVDNMLRQGPFGYLLGELARQRLARQGPPTVDDVRAALVGASPRPRERNGGETPPSRRPVVLILLESFWDPTRLRSAGLSGDPLAPRFRELWSAAGESAALSPEFGGATANAEMEVLCGIPTRLVFPGVVFASGLANDLPCLPRILSRGGLRAEAHHPNAPSFWSRARAYPRVGFTRFFSAGDFDRDDLNGDLLSDESLYRQAWSRTREGPPGSVALTYVLTYTGHWPYDLNPARRAYEISARSAPEIVGRYASSVLHSSRELAAFVDRVLADEPDALVVALGDHLPSLGETDEAYRKSGLVDDPDAGLTASTFRSLTTVPLLVVDGKAGPLPVGTISQFEVPSLVLERLGLPVPEWMDALLPPPGWHVRTREDGLLVLSPDGSEHYCRTPAEGPACDVGFRWLERARVLSRDLVEGRQHALALSRDGASPAE